MGYTKVKVKRGIDKAAVKTNDVAGKVIDKTKSAARSTGNAIERAGRRLSNSGKR